MGIKPEYKLTPAPSPTGAALPQPEAGTSEEVVLRRTLGLRTVVSTSAGLTFASSTFLVVAYIGYMLRGNTSWIPICVAGLLCLLAAAAFAELNGIYPSAAGIRLWIQRAL